MADGDFSSITWTMLVCTDGGDCGSVQLSGPQSCQAYDTGKHNCALWRSTHGGTACSLDGGTQ